MDFTPLSPADEARALAFIGVKSFEEILEPQIPAAARLSKDYDLPLGCSEIELRREMDELAGKNRTVDAGKNFLGGGIYNHFVPAVVPALWSRSEFVTAYTPYQPEVSQGILQSVFEFQTMISELTALPVANASMYDGASATAEAAHVAVAHTKRKKVTVAGTIHPEYLETLRTYLRPQEVEIDVLPVKGGRVDLGAADEALAGASSAALIVQHPNFFGNLEDVERLSKTAEKSGALLISVVDPISLGLLKPPGEYGAAIAVGEGQSLGIDPSLGGPGFGFFACKDELMRLIPGRICGRTKDTEGRTGYVLTLQAREQHIRRERATSNICTNHQLMALAATIYLAALGPDGLLKVAEGCYRRSHYLAAAIEERSPWRLAHDAPFFKEFVIELDSGADPKLDGDHGGAFNAPQKIVAALASRGYYAGIPLSRFGNRLGHGDAGHSRQLMIAVTEQHTREDLDAFVEVLTAATREVLS